MTGKKPLNDIIKDAITGKKIIIGANRTAKHLKMEKLKLVIVSNNCPESLKKDVAYYAGLAGIAVETFDGTSKQLGVVCGKPFPIAILSIM